MSFIYYCDKCKKTHTVEEDYKVVYCPDCKLLLRPMHITDKDWNAKTDEEKESNIASFLTKNTSDSNSEKTNSSSNNNAETNPIGKALTVSGWIYIALTVIGALVMKNDGYELWLVAGFLGALAGLLILGIGEIIKLLHDIKNKL